MSDVSRKRSQVQLLSPLIVALLVVFMMSAVVHISLASANDTEPLSFEFIKHPPGEMVSLTSHRVHVNCIGEGDTTVLFESGLGGGSLEWLPVQRALSSRVMACAYDRSGYAWSDPSPFPRHAVQIAHEATGMLVELNVSGPLLLVGHSFGGFISRLLASESRLNVIGMVLIDTSHEDQFALMEGAGSRSVMPTSGNFVISASSAPLNLPKDIRRQVQALSRMRKHYLATHAEMALFRESARQVKQRRRILTVPLVVLQRGQDPFDATDQGAQKKNAIWDLLQQDLVTLSENGNAIVAKHSGHHVHIDQPDLVVTTIEALIDGYEQE